MTLNKVDKKVKTYGAITTRKVAQIHDSSIEYELISFGQGRCWPHAMMFFELLKTSNPPSWLMVFSEGLGGCRCQIKIWRETLETHPLPRTITNKKKANTTFKTFSGDAHLDSSKPSYWVSSLSLSSILLKQI